MLKSVSSTKLQFQLSLTKMQEANDNDIRMVLLVEPHDREYDRHHPSEFQQMLRRYIHDNFSREDVAKMSDEILKKTNFVDLWNFIGKIYETDKKEVDETSTKGESVVQVRGIIEMCVHSNNGTCVCEET